MKYLFTLICLALFSAPSLSTDYFSGRGVIDLNTGDIASFEIDISINDKGAVKGFYAYYKNKPIQLVGNLANNIMHLKAPQFNEVIEVTLQKNKGKILGLNGSWKSNGKIGEFRASADNTTLGVCGQRSKCDTELAEIIIERAVISGEQKLCKSFLNSYLTYFTLDESKSFHTEPIFSSTRERLHISKGSLSIDINNDLQKERLIQIGMYSGRGTGCDQEYLQQTNSNLTAIEKNKLNSLLSPSSCKDYVLPFEHNGIIYLENRSRLYDWGDFSDIDPKEYDTSNFYLLTEVHLIDKDSRSKVCGFKYKSTKETEDRSLKAQCSKGYKSYSHASGYPSLGICPVEKENLAVEIQPVGDFFAGCSLSGVAHRTTFGYELKKSACTVNLVDTKDAYDVGFIGTCSSWCGSKASFREGEYSYDKMGH